YRYTEPAAQDADAFIAAHRSRGLTLRVKGSDRPAGREPLFLLTVIPVPSRGPTTPDQAQAAAQQFLATHSLTPTWSFHITVEAGSSASVVRYERFFDVPGSPGAPQIDSGGQRAGLEVSVSAGQVAEVAGPLPLQLQRASYPSRGADSLLRAALSQPAAGGSTLGAVPRVVLNRAQLVYVAVPAGGYGVYEPAFLFTGTFQFSGQAYEKRVLVVALDDSELSG
ncbi:MAG TPA: hypothetical protein VK131_11790, partial [Candidatus Acidoferrales bacterium]|nr:hypothetical protein [Candidatus Acidoferrales bacterium]